MNRSAVLIVLVVGVVTGGVLYTVLHAGCPALGDAAKSRLISFVHSKYNVPSTSEIDIADGGVISGSCFRRLVFATVSGRRFEVHLVASPDFRFLTTELLDAEPDVKAEAKRRQQTAEALTRGRPPVLGSDGANVTVAVFSDCECPYCAAMAKCLEGLAVSKADRIRVIYHYFPLAFHPWARKAAEAAACAQRQNTAAFWALHDFFFAHQREFSPADLPGRLSDWVKTEADLDHTQFQRCVANSLTSGDVDQDIALGTELGVSATPTVFVNGLASVGPSVDDMRAQIHRAVAGNEGVD